MALSLVSSQCLGGLFAFSPACAAVWLRAEVCHPPAPTMARFDRCKSTVKQQTTAIADLADIIFVYFPRHAIVL